MNTLECAQGGSEQREMPCEGILGAAKNRLLQTLARSMSGAFTFRVWAHRMRGVAMGA